MLFVRPLSWIFVWEKFRFGDGQRSGVTGVKGQVSGRVNLRSDSKKLRRSGNIWRTFKEIQRNLTLVKPEQEALGGRRGEPQLPWVRWQKLTCLGEKFWFETISELRIFLDNGRTKPKIIWRLRLRIFNLKHFSKMKILVDQYVINY